MLDRSMKAVLHSFAYSLDYLREQVADLAVMAAGRIIGESLDAKKHRELIERTIEEAEIRA